MKVCNLISIKLQTVILVLFLMVPFVKSNAQIGEYDAKIQPSRTSFIRQHSGVVNSNLEGQKSLISGITRFPHQHNYLHNFESLPLELANGNLLLVWIDSIRGAINDTLKISISSDEGSNWSSPTTLVMGDSLANLTGVKTQTGRIIIIFQKKLSVISIMSDDNGLSWGSPNTLFDASTNRHAISLTQTTDGKLWLSYIYTRPSQTRNRYRTSTDNGNSWSTENLFNITTSGNPYYPIIISSGMDSALIAIYTRTGTSTKNDLWQSISIDRGVTWMNNDTIVSTPLDEIRPRVISSSNGTFWLFYEVIRTFPFPELNYLSDLYFIKSTNYGTTWSQPTQFTRYAGNDTRQNVTTLNGEPFLSFSSTRWLSNRNTQIYLAPMNVANDTNPPPTMFKFGNSEPVQNSPINITATIFDETGISSATVTYLAGGTTNGPIPMYDDGQHNDGGANDSVWGCAIGPIQRASVTYYFEVRDIENNFMQFDGTTLFLQDNHRFWINNIIMPFNSQGVLGDVTVNGDEGGSFQTLDKDFLYSGGFMMSGKSNGNLWANGVASASRVQDYNSGRVLTDSSDIPGIYAVDILDTPFSSSWQQWKGAVKLGAVFYDGNGDNEYNPVDLNGNGLWDASEDAPDLLGEKVAWCVFNDNTPSIQRRWNNVAPQGIDIQQSMFAYRSDSALTNVLFIRYRIINRGTVAAVMDSVYFSPWADVDMGNYTDDLVGCDTVRNAGYTWNDGDDPTFGVQAPTCMMPFLQGPVVYIAGETFIDANGNGQYDDGEVALDTAVSVRGKFLGTQYFPGAKNLGMSSFVNFVQSDPIHGDPATHIEARNYMLGGLKDGSKFGPCLDPYGGAFGLPCTSIDSVFWYSGDPTLTSSPGTPNGYGWIHTSPNDARQMENIGPFTLKQNVPVDIIIAYVVGQGTDARNSITVARTITDAAKSIYSQNFPVGVSPLKENAIPKRFELFQNYPNPFNPATTIRFAIHEQRHTILKIYNILGEEVTTLLNKNIQPGVYSVPWDASNLPSGMYFYRLTAGTFSETKKLLLLK
ncbi:MAG: exo-alpha-sialidase [Ignavibacteriales bacterium]|nr:exo-alpha-sialidase [Ignavibacteriales bacterium]